jgi:hypothetical protein
MEEAGVLRAVKLVPGTHGQTYYTWTNINAVVEHGAPGGDA